MIKKRSIQILFLTIYCTLGVVGLLASLGLFDKHFNSNFYVYYTNLSNYICLGFMFVSLVKVLKKGNNNENGLIAFAPRFKFMCLIMILVTFLVYNIFLAKQSPIEDYFTSLTNLTLHVILPLMFVVDWILFYEHNFTHWSYPLLSLIMPLIYVAFIVIRGLIVDHKTTEVVYPYFFLDIDTLGWGGFFLWLIGLVLAFVVIGYLLYIFDHIKEIKAKFAKKEDINAVK